MNADEMHKMTKHVLSILQQQGLYDVAEKDLFVLLAREWSPYAYTKPRYDDPALDRLVAAILQTWRRKRRNGIRGLFLTALQAGIRDYCAPCRHPVQRPVQPELFGGSHGGGGGE